MIHSRSGRKPENLEDTWITWHMYLSKLMTRTYRHHLLHHHVVTCWFWKCSPTCHQTVQVCESRQRRLRGQIYIMCAVYNLHHIAFMELYPSNTIGTFGRIGSKHSHRLISSESTRSSFLSITLHFYHIRDNINRHCFITLINLYLLIYTTNF